VFLDTHRLGDEERIAAFTTRALTMFGKAVLIAPSRHARDQVVGRIVPEGTIT
jgi:hypothetical protein